VGGSPDAVLISTFDADILPATITAWIYADTLTACDGLVFSRGTNVSGINITACSDGTRMGYHWNDAASTYNWVGGPTVPSNEWIFVALVVESTQATAYVGSSSGLSSATNVVAHATSTIDDLKFGEDENGTRHFDGRIDEVRIYNRALNFTEIQKMANGNSPEHSMGAYTLQDSLDVEGELIINSGELDAGSNNNINVAGSWLNHGGVFDEKSGLVTMDATSGVHQILEMQTFYNIMAVVQHLN